MHITQQEAQIIVDEMKAAIHHNINIMDETGTILASTNPARQGQLHQGAIRVIKENLSLLSIQEDDFEAKVQRGINLPICINNNLEGVIGITGDPHEVSVFGDVIKRMTEILLESTYQREQIDLIDRAKSLFVENWLFSEDPDWPELEMRGKLLSININEPYTVALMTAAEDGSEKHAGSEKPSEMRSNLILRMAQNHLTNDPSHFCTVVRNRLFILLCKVSHDEAFSVVDGICRRIENHFCLKMNAGISSHSRTAEDIRHCYLEAKTALSVARQSDSEHIIVFYNKVSLDFISQSIPISIKQDLRDLIFASCTEHEQQEFQQTIQLYFNLGGDIQKCADKLFLHRNTFQYRIDCIKKRTGFNLKLPKDSTLLYLAIL